MSNFGKADPVTSICTADRKSITFRGKDFCEDVIGGMGLGAFIFFHLTAREPSEGEAKMLEALIISITEHGMSPTALAARMTISAAPEALQGAVAAGILGAGSVLLGSADETAALLAEGLAMMDAGTSDTEAADDIVARVLDAGDKLPGFGHPLHKPDDPRSVRLLELADEHGVAGRNTQFLHSLSAAADRKAGKHLVLNVQAPIASISADMGFPPFMSRAIPILARAIGVLGHIAEEQERPLGMYATMLANQHIQYEPPGGGERLDLLRR
ncbi:citryl-CoA lyase [Aurantiacibacter sediminis]|uniref:citrate synthase (unknown stereospecificity) n=1 Tax=Aurantiacibacter sediminis TaxID=2793064 RepID=A0ABS0N6U2_9SPHN|nr:citryl-CoA lyase [Aurantiacibacter sediminis]MBH5323476.1 citryl-CoA lyase [Aurantiacibacter sediminis]